jgi:fibrillarin-like pre-rRNA processing protein
MLIPEQVDVIYADVAQPEQAQIIIANAETFLKSQGWILLFVKSRSIDVTMAPEQVYEAQIKILKQSEFKIVEVTFLDPFSGDHALIVAQWLK